MNESWLQKPSFRNRQATGVLSGELSPPHLCISVIKYGIIISPVSGTEHLPGVTGGRRTCLGYRSEDIILLTGKPAAGALLWPQEPVTCLLTPDRSDSRAWELKQSQTVTQEHSDLHLLAEPQDLRSHNFPQLHRQQRAMCSNTPGNVLSLGHHQMAVRN